jgi:curved DNA-binding protein CbpA
LGLPTGAGISEVKAAFRQMAKMYHPDVNPEGKEKFTTILKAYEVLSDPHLKYSYDYKLNTASRPGSAQNEQKGKGKNWRFDERELKRRQYYNEYIRKYEKKQSHAAERPEPKATYNEFKYILFATPLAVALFLGIMTLTSGRTKKNTEQPGAAKAETSQPHSDLKMGDAPYTWYFGAQKFEPETNRKISINNRSGNELVICFFKDSAFMRSLYIEKDYRAEISELPAGKLEMRYSSGRNFVQHQKITGMEVTGAFSEDLLFFRTSNGITEKQKEIDIEPGLNQGFTASSAKEFFRKQL